MQEQRETLVQRLGKAVGRLCGWRVEVMQMPPARCVIIGYPHTTGWDLMIGFLLMAVSGVRFNWVAKDDYFRFPPLAWLLHRLGGISVNRRSRTNFVDQMIQAFEDGRITHLAIIPDGTRHKARYWKTGFYYIALGAHVPIVMAFGDYPSRVIGFGPSFWPSGDIYADMEIIRGFYVGRKGKYPDQHSEIRLKEEMEVLERAA